MGLFRGRPRLSLAGSVYTCECLFLDNTEMEQIISA